MKAEVQYANGPEIGATNMAVGDWAIISAPEGFKDQILHRLDAKDEHGHAMWAIFADSTRVGVRAGGYGDSVWARNVKVRPLRAGDRVVIEV